MFKTAVTFLVAAVLVGIMTTGAFADTLEDTILVGRPAGSGLQLDPATGDYAGLLTRVSAGGSGLTAIDLTYSPETAVGYAVRGNDTMYEVDSNLVYTGRQVGGLGNMVSIEWGADNMLYVGCIGGSTVQIDPTTLTYTGKQTRDSLGNSIDALGIAIGTNGYGYAVRGTDTLYEVDSDLVYTGRQVGGLGNLVSIEWGPDDMLYVGRANDSLIQIDPVTLTYTGVETNDGAGSSKYGADISFAPDGTAWVATGSSTAGGYQVDGTTLEYTGVDLTSGQGEFSSIFYVVPEPATMGLLAVGGFSLLMRRKRQA